MKTAAVAMVLILLTGTVHAYSVKTKTISEDGTAPRYSIAAQYPVMKGLRNNSAQDALNSMLSKWVLNRITQFRTDLDAMESPNATSRLPGDNRISVTYSLKVKTDHILGIAWDVYQQFAGAAHPSEVLNVMVYDLDTGRQLMLADVFIPGSPYLKRLSQFCTQQLTVAAANSGYPLFEEGLRPIPKNFENFLLRPEGLYIVFNPYQVAPYVAGVQEVTVPYTVVADLLQPGGPVSLVQESH